MTKTRTILEQNRTEHKNATRPINLDFQFGKRNQHQLPLDPTTSVVIALGNLINEKERERETIRKMESSNITLNLG